MSALPTLEAHVVSLTYQTARGAIRELTGVVWDYDRSLIVDATGYPATMHRDAAREVLRGAIEDGRAKLPDDVRARVDSGKAVLR